MVIRIMSWSPCNYLSLVPTVNLIKCVGLKSFMIPMSCMQWETDFKILEKKPWCWIRNWYPKVTWVEECCRNFSFLQLNLKKLELAFIVLWQLLSCVWGVSFYKRTKPKNKITLNPKRFICHSPPSSHKKEKLVKQRSCSLKQYQHS